MVRLLLIMLLPIIAAVLYLEGQQYNSALINFQSSSTPSSASFFPRVIEGFNRSGPIQHYTRENLYEYVNGHAEYFISAGFLSLSVGEYLRAGADPDRPEVVVEVYEMGNGIEAFGVFVDETGSNTLPTGAGRTSFKSSQGLSFLADRYYVKIDAYEKNIDAETFAEKIEGKIGGTSELPPLFSQFPVLGTVIRTRYIKEAYRGLEFMQNVIEREYDLNGTSIRVFLVPGDDKKIHELIGSFVDYFRDSDIKYDVVKDDGGTYYKVMDPYEGDWYLLPLGDSVFGIFGAADSGLLKPFFKDAGTQMPIKDH
jgi:hypothetical protein